MSGFKYKVKLNHGNTIEIPVLLMQTDLNEKTNKTKLMTNSIWT